MTAGLAPLDYGIIAGSLVIVFAVAIWSSIYKNVGGAESYFLAGRSMPWFICAASIFASNVGIEHFVGMPGAGASGGLAVGLYEWTAAYQILMLGWLFAPIYLRCKLTTIPEFLELRYNKYCRFLYVLITMVAYVTSKLGASLYAGALFLNIVAGLSIWQAVPVIICATAIYTIAGGLTAVMLTDAVQMLIFVFGGLAGAIRCLQLIGGFQNVFSILRERNLDFMTHVIHSPDDRDYPWPGMTLGLAIASTWYWCLDQEMAQRVLSSKNLDHAQIGCATAGYLKILPVLLTVVPGMVARALFEQCKAVGEFPEWCADPAFALDEGNNADKVYALIIVREFRTGLKGIMMATFLAALMSSLSSVYNSASTIFTYDVYERMKYPEGNGPAKELVNVGRVTVVVLTLLTFAWIPVIEKSKKGLFMVLQNATMHLAGPIVAIFLLAIFWKRANGPGALSGFVSGSILGIGHLLISVIFEDKCDAYVDESAAGIKQVYTSSNWFMCMNYLYVSIFLCIFSMLVTIIVSLVTEPPTEAQLKGRMFEDWGFWVKLCSCVRSSKGGSVSNKPRDDGAEGEIDNAPLIDPEEPLEDSSTFDMGKCRILANLSGVGVLIVITVLIITFR